MKAKFTKGEWFVLSSVNLYSIIKSTNGKRIAEVKSYGTRKPFNDPTTEQREANEKLICAAPDLFYACVNAAKTLISAGVTEESEIMKQLIKAIEKATK